MPIQIVQSPIFEVWHEAFECPRLSGAQHLAIDFQCAKKELTRLDVGQRNGVYIFAIVHHKRSNPWYVGKASKLPFSREVFNDSNCRKYSEATAKQGRGNPVIYFLCHPKQPGKLNYSAISRLENIIIQDCAGQNEDLRNRRNIKIHQIRIGGVMNAGVGRPGKAATEIRKMTGRW